MVSRIFTRIILQVEAWEEYQILDDKLAEDNKKENFLTGSFCDRLAPNASVKKMNEPGQWNSIRIVAKDRQVEHGLNGVKILDFTRSSPAFTEAVDMSKFNYALPPSERLKKVLFCSNNTSMRPRLERAK